MLSLLAALWMAAAPPAASGPVPSASSPPASAPSGSDKPAPLTAQQAVDANGVPAWAKRKPKQPVQSCETRPNIGIETWRQHYDTQGKDRLRPRVPTSTCR